MRITGFRHRLSTFDAVRKASDLELLQLFLVDRTQHTYTVHDGRLRSIMSIQPLDARQRRLVAGVELARRAAYEELSGNTVALSRPAVVRDYLLHHFLGCDEERFVSIWLDARHRIIAADELFRGTLTQTSVYPRVIVKEALARNAAAVIFAHNHPSGVAEPSQGDRLLTERLKEALALVDVTVLDHFIVANQQTLSMADRGWM